MMVDTVRVSAPGKVLLTGGYLVLEERFSGLVLATSARFHTTISRRPQERLSSETELLRIHVESPQFDQHVIASVVDESQGRVELRIAESSDRNSYVEETLLCTLNGVLGLDDAAARRSWKQIKAAGEEVHVLLQADNAFYSQATRLQQAHKSLCRQHLEELPAFLPPVVDGENTIAKTGLGSSAALVTSLVGSIVRFFTPEIVSLDVIHNLAQLSHCFVQRKIGSGFDVSTACYGSQRYSRFPATLLDAFTTPDNLQPALIAACVRDQSKWAREQRVKPFAMPSSFHLLMGDVSAGSATVSMVRQVLQWQKRDPVQAQRVVTALSTGNEAVERRFKELRNLSERDALSFESACCEMARTTAEHWKQVDATIGGQLEELRAAYARVRHAFREMGELAGVPIEPPVQTSLIDATLQVPGVLIAGVPGAGGYDALFVVTLDASVADSVEQLWLQRTHAHPAAVICPLLCDVAPSNADTLQVEEI